MMILNIKLLIISLTHHNNLYADVNIKDANYFKVNDDVSISRDRREFSLRRMYSSRSMNQGPFGFGWTSNMNEHTNDIKIKSDEQGRIVQITTSRDKYHYRYDGIYLIEVRKNGRLRFIYKYDDLGNMTEYNDQFLGKSEKIKYDRDNDRILNIIKSDGCEDRFSYKFKSELEYSTIYEKLCHQKITESTRFTFIHNKSAQDEIRLSRVVIKQNLSRIQSFLNRTNGAKNIYGEYKF